MPKIIRKWKCVFKGGKPILEDPSGFKKECEKMEGKEGYVSIIPWRKMKSNEQNKYYRGCLVQIFAEYWGTTNQEAHEALSNEHLRVRLHPEMPEIVKSTANHEWNTEEWERYMEFLRKWGAQEFGLYIPEPREIDLESLPDIYY